MVRGLRAWKTPAQSCVHSGTCTDKSGIIIEIVTPKEAGASRWAEQDRARSPAMPRYHSPSHDGQVCYFIMSSNKQVQPPDMSSLKCLRFTWFRMVTKAVVLIL